MRRLCCAFFAVFLLGHLFKYTECNSRLRSRAGLGDHIDREIPVADDIDQMLDISRADGITNEINFRRLPDRLECGK